MDEIIREINRIESEGLQGAATSEKIQEMIDTLGGSIRVKPGDDAAAASYYIMLLALLRMGQKK